VTQFLAFVLIYFVSGTSYNVKESEYFSYDKLSSTLSGCPAADLLYSALVFIETHCRFDTVLITLSFWSILLQLLSKIQENMP